MLPRDLDLLSGMHNCGLCLDVSSNLVALLLGLMESVYGCGGPQNSEWPVCIISTSLREDEMEDREKIGEFIDSK